MARLINKRDVALYVEELTEQKNHGIPYIKLNRTNKGRGKGKIELYPITIVNLLGKYGNFEVDSNGDGLADGWSVSSGVTSQALSTSSVFGSYSQQISTDGAALRYLDYIYRNFGSVQSGDILFASVFLKVTATSANVLPYLTINTGSNICSKSGTQQNVFEHLYLSIVAGDLTSSIIAAGMKDTTSAALQAGDTAYIDGFMLINLTSMGQLPLPLKEFFQNQVTNWEDLATTSNITAVDGRTQTGEDWLAELLPYCDSVATAGYSLIDGQLNVIVKNKGGNLLNVTWLPSLCNNERGYYSPAWGARIILSSTKKVIAEVWADASGIGQVAKIIPNKTYYLSATNVGEQTINLRVTERPTANYNVFSTYPYYKTTVAPGQRGVLSFSSDSPFVWISIDQLNSGILSVENIILSEQQTEYTPPRKSKIELDTELWGLNGVYEFLFDDNKQLKKIKRFERVLKVSDGSGNITLSGYQSGTKCILINEDNGETKIVDVGSTIATGWNNANVTVIYRVSTPTIEELGTNELRLFRNDNYILVSHVVKDTFTGDGITTTFNLSRTANNTYYQVYVNGEAITERITKTTTSITFDNPPKNGALIEVPTGNEELLDFITNLSINVQNSSRAVTNVFGEQEVRALNEVYQIRFTRNLLENIDDFYQQYKDKTFRLKILNTSTNDTL